MVFRISKRIFDIVLALLLAIPVTVLIIFFAFLVYLTDFHNPFYVQKRLGYYGKEFKLYKIRSMRIDAENNVAQITVKDDERITKIGRFLRKRRIDELPQLLNVFLGQMSFVGPRPERKEIAEKISLTIPNFNDRLATKPGLTGLAQINGGYELEPDEKLSYDLKYVEQQSFCLDVAILFKTILVVLNGTGAR